uniref:SWIM-type domain-containing protein n=1 Tax=Onchocerca flexuosa TaxID=387005 RepID=A0A183HLG8_9BILA
MYHIWSNLSSDMKLSKAAIYSELKAKQKNDYMVLCSHSSVSFTSDSTNYCVCGNTDHLCYESFCLLTINTILPNLNILENLYQTGSKFIKF